MVFGHDGGWADEGHTLANLELGTVCATVVAVLCSNLITKRGCTMR